MKRCAFVPAIWFVIRHSAFVIPLLSCGAALLPQAVAGEDAPKPPRKWSPSLGRPPQAGEEYVNPKDGSVLVWLPGGEFIMGSQDGPEDERPASRTRVEGFWLGKYEVTNAQYGIFLRAERHREPGYWDDPDYNRPDQPVVAVTWIEAHAYCTWAGLRLPTEAEWEYAAAGGKQLKYPTATGDISHDLANIPGTGGRDKWDGPAPIASFPRNPFGLFDLAGNAWEWTSTTYKEYPYSATDGREATGSYGLRVMRGGSWHFSPATCRTAYRHRFESHLRYDYVGLRVVLSAVEVQAAPEAPTPPAPKPSAPLGPGPAAAPAKAPAPGATFTNPTDGSVLVWVRGGEFLMGSKDGPEDEQPQRRVKVEGFWLGKHEVTNRQYAKFLKAANHREPAYWGEPGYDQPDQPVAGVIWYEAQAYGKWAGLRLPTEAEWEYAAAGGKQLKYPTATGEISHDLANIAGAGGRDRWADTPAPVGSFPPNPFGLFDLAGNAWEWTSTLYKDYPYSATDGRENTAKEYGLRVLRGGSWHFDPDTCRTAYRRRFASHLRYDYAGLRVAMTPPAAEAAEAPPEKPPAETPTPAAAPAQEPKPGTEFTNPADGSVLVWIPGREFLMGSNDGPDDERPQHKVQVEGFWLGKYEVTNARYARFLKNKAAQGLIPGLWDTSGYNSPDQPVVALTWLEAQAYVTWATLRLPSEAEWEYAAAGGKQLAYPTATGEISHDLANIPGMGGKDTWDDVPAPVGSFPPNPFGLYDLAGNAWEWTSSFLKPYPYSATDGREDTSKYRGMRVMRGGCWHFRTETCRTTYRHRFHSHLRLDYAGLRVALSKDAPQLKLAAEKPPKPQPKPPAPPLEAKPGSEFTNPTDGSVLVWIPAGDFLMGRDDGPEDERPRHKVHVQGFWLGKYEITNRQYAKFLKASPRRPPGYWDDPDYHAPAQPVVALTWLDAQAYAKWAGLRLPTEAEWEYAAAGGKQLPYPTATGDISHDLANFAGMGGKDTWDDSPAPVGTFPPNPFGLCDMAGNAWEWTCTLYQKYPYSATDGRNDTRDEYGLRVMRGGCWHFAAAKCSTAFRHRFESHLRLDFAGLRVALSPDDTAPEQGR